MGELKWGRKKVAIGVIWWVRKIKTRGWWVRVAEPGGYEEVEGGGARKAMEWESEDSLIKMLVLGAGDEGLWPSLLMA